jgi:hypothetical protein
MNAITVGEKRYKIIFAIIALIAVAVSMVWARSFYGSMQSFREGEAHLKAERYIRAITYFDRSIHWYTPFNPYVEKSAKRLWEIGEHGEEHGDIKLALIAYRTIRRGFYAASHFVTPGREWIERSESKINALLLLEEKKKRVPEEIVLLRKKLSKDQESTAPRILWTVILEIGFLGWIGSLICFIMFVLRRKREADSLTLSSFIWITLAAIFFTLWIVGMMKA